MSWYIVCDRCGAKADVVNALRPSDWSYERIDKEKIVDLCPACSKAVDDFKGREYAKYNLIMQEFLRMRQ